MAPLCAITANADMYGLGIRLGFYVQWFSTILVEYLDETDLPNLRVLGLAFSVATFIGLAIQASESFGISPSEMYIVLLLCMGSFLIVVPLYFWRGLSCCNPNWDPVATSEENPSPVFRISNFGMLLVSAGFSVWYWCAFVAGKGSDPPCVEFGFFFSPVSLFNRGFVAVNAIFYLSIIIVCCGILISKAGCDLNLGRKKRSKKKLRRRMPIIRGLKAVASLITASTLTAAIELTVLWNNLDSVNTITTAAQAIPLVVSAAVATRSIFMHFALRQVEEVSEEESSISSRSSFSGHWSRRFGPAGPSYSTASRSTGPPREPPRAQARRTNSDAQRSPRPPPDPRPPPGPPASDGPARQPPRPPPS